MTITFSVLLTAAAVVFFCLAAASVTLGSVPLIAVGLACYAAGRLPWPL